MVIPYIISGLDQMRKKRDKHGIEAIYKLMMKTSVLNIYKDFIGSFTTEPINQM